MNSGDSLDHNDKEPALLCIAVPTYNRATFLGRCLSSIIDQTPADLRHLVRIVVSDNASEDNTTQVVQGFQGLGVELIYNRNEENLGVDRNFMKCLDLMGDARYWMLLGDDDWIRPEKIPHILDLLLREDPLDAVFLECRPRYAEMVSKRDTFLVSREEFIRYVNHYLTFISCLILPPSAYASVRSGIDTYRGSHLIQLAWIFPHIARAQRLAVVGDFVIEAEPGNSGGYAFAKVFVTNFWNMWREFFSQDAKRNKWFRVNMMLFFYQTRIIELREGSPNAFEPEINIASVFDQEFGNELAYKLICKPVLKLPLPLARGYCRLFSIFRFGAYLQAGMRIGRLGRTFSATHPLIREGL
jgi:glycosyltransferase involved in cell wall biosynthesis